MTDEPDTAELENRIETLEATIEKMMPSRRDALKMGGAALAGGSLMAGTASADTVDEQVGTIGGPNEEVDLVSEDIDNSNQITTKDLVVTDTATGPFGSDLQGCRVHMAFDQSISASNTTKIQFEAKDYDSNNNFDTSSHQWTCPEDGLYIANLGVEFGGGGSGDQRRIAIGSGQDPFPSGQGAQSNFANTNQNHRNVITTMNKYSQNDTIAAYVLTESNDLVRNLGGTNSDSFFEVAFLGNF